MSPGSRGLGLGPGLFYNSSMELPHVERRRAIETVSQALGEDRVQSAKTRRALIERGIYNFPLPTKQGSISFAHSEEDIDLTLAATDAALHRLLE